MTETIWAQADPTGASGYATTTEDGSYGLFFTVSVDTDLKAVWFYSPAGASALPSWTALYSTTNPGAAGTLVAQNNSPSWSGAAGSGWVRDDSFPSTPVSTGTDYVAAYYGASFLQGYLYTGSEPSAWFPATSGAGHITAPAYVSNTSAGCNGPYLNGSKGCPYPGLNGLNINWLADVEVSASVDASVTGVAAGVTAAGGPFGWASGDDGPGPWRLFGSADGPSSATSNSTSETQGVLFDVTSGDMWFGGYWYWLCSSGGQATSGVKFALWNVGTPTGVTAAGSLVSGSTVTSGTLTAGWNYIPLASPLPLSAGQVYIAAVGNAGTPYPSTASQWKSGEPYAAGITTGYLNAYSGTTGSNEDPYAYGQGVYSTAGSDPGSHCPGTVSDANYWIDVQVSHGTPEDYAGSFRLWPNGGTDGSTSFDSATTYNIGMEFRLTEPCAVGNIWWYSMESSPDLPSKAEIWSVDPAGVTGSSVYADSSPSWSGDAGTGWVSVAVSDLTLPAGTYRVSAYNGAGSASTVKRLGYWGGGGDVDGGGPQVTDTGISFGPLYAPASAGAAPCYEYDTGSTDNEPPFTGMSAEAGQSVFANSTDIFPNLYVDGLYQNYWIDVEVTPASQDVAGTAAEVTAAGGIGTPSGGADTAGTAASVTAAGGTGSLSAGADIAGAAASVPAAGGIGAPSGSASVTGAAASVAAAGGIGTPSGSADISGAAAEVVAAGGVGGTGGGSSGDVDGVAAAVTAAGGTGVPSGSAVIAGSAAAVTGAGGTGALVTSADVTGAAAAVTAAGGIGAPSGSSPDANVTGVAAAVTAAGGIGTPSGGVLGILTAAAAATSTLTAGTAATAVLTASTAP